MIRQFHFTFCNPRLTQYLLFLLILLLLVFAFGCETSGITEVKTRGVYTTLLSPETAPLVSNYTPGAAYNQRDSFGHNETPLAVIIGCDGFSVTLELDDLSDGHTLMSKEIYTGIGRMSFQPLLISKSGEYKVRILLRGSELDSFKFSVEREPVMTSEGKPNFDAIISRTSLLISTDTNDPALYLVRMPAYAAKGELDNAIADCDRIIQLEPYNAEAYVFRAGLYYAGKKWNDSLPDWNEYIRLKPDDPSGLFGRAYAFEKLNDFEKAISDLQIAMQIFPEDLRGTNYLPGEIVDLDNQISGLSIGLRSSVSYNRICNSLAWLLATCPDVKLCDGKKSIRLATEVCESTSWKFVPAIDTLAAGYAEADDFDNAVKFEQQALQLIGSTSKKAEAFQQRLSLYKQHQAYHQAAN